MQSNSIFDPIKIKYGDLEDFKKRFTFMSCLPSVMECSSFDLPENIKKEAKEVDKKFIEKIEKYYQNGDELWHFDDFGFAPVMSSREYIILRRDGKTIKEFLIRMS